MKSKVTVPAIQNDSILTVGLPA